MSSLFSVFSGVFFAFVAISSWKHTHTQCSLLLSSKAVCDMRSDGDAPFSNIQFHKFYIICFALLLFMLIQFFDVTMRLHWVTRCLHLWFWPMTLSHISHIEYAIVFISRRKKMEATYLRQCHSIYISFSLFLLIENETFYCLIFSWFMELKM